MDFKQAIQLFQDFNGRDLAFQFGCTAQSLPILKQSFIDILYYEHPDILYNCWPNLSNWEEKWEYPNRYLQVSSDENDDIGAYEHRDIKWTVKLQEYESLAFMDAYFSTLDFEYYNNINCVISIMDWYLRNKKIDNDMSIEIYAAEYYHWECEEDGCESQINKLLFCVVIDEDLEDTVCVEIRLHHYDTSNIRTP